MLVAISRSDSKASDTEKTARINWDNYKDKLSSLFIIIPISESVPADTRYTLYITNQRFLFSGEMKLYRRSIQVGGRRFY
jgi:uncharacterized protein YpmS